MLTNTDAVQRATPAGATFTSETQDTGAIFSCTNPTVGGTGTTTCTGSLTAGASASFTIVDTANSNLADGDTITNTAKVTADGRREVRALRATHL